MGGQHGGSAIRHAGARWRARGGGYRDGVVLAGSCPIVVILLRSYLFRSVCTDSDCATSAWKVSIGLYADGRRKTVVALECHKCQVFGQGKLMTKGIIEIVCMPLATPYQLSILILKVSCF